MRRLARVVTLAFVAMVAGCTFLIDFEEVDPSVSDAAVVNDVAPRDASAPVDGRVPDTGPPAFPPPCDPGFPLADVKCNVNFPRPNCATNMTVFPSYPAGRVREGDLVTCNGGPNPTCVQHCPFGCTSMPTGFPDACDDCNGRPNGTYCVKDLRGPDGRNLGLAIDCKDGKQVADYICGVGKCATTCPRTDRKPSCCI